MGETRPILFAQQPIKLATLDLFDAVSEHPLDRRALVGHDAVCIENGDEVAGMCDERAEPSFVLPPVQILGQRGSLEGQRDLCPQSVQRIGDLWRDPRCRRDDQQTPDIRTDRKREDGDGLAVRQPKIRADERGQILMGNPKHP